MLVFMSTWTKGTLYWYSCLHGPDGNCQIPTFIQDGLNEIHQSCDCYTASDMNNFTQSQDPKVHAPFTVIFSSMRTGNAYAYYTQVGGNCTILGLPTNTGVYKIGSGKVGRGWWETQTACQLTNNHGRQQSEWELVCRVIMTLSTKINVCQYEASYTCTCTCT